MDLCIELGIMWKKSALDYFNKAFQHFYGGLGKPRKTSAGLRVDIRIHYHLNKEEDFKLLNSNIR
jgi:hypothetical protein